MRRRLWGVFTRCEIVKCADHETYWLTDEDDPVRAAKAMVKGGVKCAIVTCGAEGAVWARKGEYGHIPSPVVKTVDTTGAGDAFMSALAARLAHEDVVPSQVSRERLESHLRFAAHMGALAVTVKGAVQGFQHLSIRVSGFGEGR